MRLRVLLLGVRLAVVLAVISVAPASGQALPPSSAVATASLHPALEASVPHHVRGEFIIKFRDDANVGAVAEELIASGTSFREVTGRTRLDELNERFRVRAMRKLSHKLRTDRLPLEDGPITKSRARLHRQALRARFEKRKDEAARPAARLRRGGARPAEVPYLEHLYLVEVEDEAADIEAICAEYAQDPDVEFAEPNYIYESEFIPNDPYYAQQWAHQVTEAESGWDINQGDPGVIIAIIDTGVDYDHPDLAGNMLGDCTGGCPVGTGYDFTDTTSSSCVDVDCTIPDNDPSDDEGHGTHVAGIAAAVGDNALGVIGVCPECRIMPVRAGYRNNQGGGSLQSDDIFNALIYAADNGADVVNMSFGSGSLSSTIADGVDYAHASDVVLVASAGNSGSNVYRYPAALDKVIAVGATSESESFASSSNYGSWMDVTAPGEAIYSTLIGNGYGDKSGTSMSAPYVAGLAGLVLAQNPTWSNEEVRSGIRGSADAVIVDVFGFGYGRVNNLAALQILDPIQVFINSPAAEQVFLNASSIPVYGTIQGAISSYEVDYGAGHAPSTFTLLLADSVPKENQLLGTIPSPPYGVFTIRIRAYNTNGDKFEDRRLVANQAAPPPVQAGWPRTVGAAGLVTSPPTVVDIDDDQDIEVLVHTLPCQLYVLDHQGNSVTGWPQNTNGTYNCQSAPAVGDVDDDGDLEVFVRSSYGGSGLNKISGFHHDGSPIAGWPLDAGNLFGYPKPSVSLGDIDGDQDLDVLYAETNALHIRRHDATSLPGWPQPSGYSTTPHFADTDDDGDLEIVTAKYLTYIIGHHHDGTNIFNNRMKSPEGRNVYDVAMGDMDGDGLVEIAAAYMYLLSAEEVFGEVVLLDHLGTILPGWPKHFEEPVSAISLGSLDDDIYPEIVVVNGKSVYIYEKDGTSLPGWPQGMGGTSYSEAAIGDIDGDGLNEVVAAASQKLFAWHRDGSVLYESGFPVVISAVSTWLAKAPAISDIDNDGDVDIVVSGISSSLSLSLPTTVTVIDLPSPYDPGHMDWPMDQHDARNSGFFPPSNMHPVADAGPDSIADEETVVVLSGSGSSDPDGIVDAFAWMQTAGPVVALNGADSETADFVAPRVTQDTPLVFELTVTDDDGGSDTATTTVTVQILDTDEDGLSDLWETDHFGDLSQGPDDDPDGDGRSNLLEFMTQSDPLVDERRDVPALGLFELAILGSLMGFAGFRSIRQRRWRESSCRESGDR